MEVKGGWFTLPCHKQHGYGLWKGVLMKEEIFISKIAFKVRQWNHIMFWEDKLCGDLPLYKRFPFLYDSSRSKGALVCEVQLQEGWNFNF